MEEFPAIATAYIIGSCRRRVLETYTTSVSVESNVTLVEHHGSQVCVGFNHNGPLLYCKGFTRVFLVLPPVVNTWWLVHPVIISRMFAVCNPGSHNTGLLKYCCNVTWRIKGLYVLITTFTTIKISQHKYFIYYYAEYASWFVTHIKA